MFVPNFSSRRVSLYEKMDLVIPLIYFIYVYPFTPYSLSDDHPEKPYYL